MACSMMCVINYFFLSKQLEYKCFAMYYQDQYECKSIKNVCYVHQNNIALMFCNAMSFRNDILATEIGCVGNLYSSSIVFSQWILNLHLHLYSFWKYHDEF